MYRYAHPAYSGYWVPGVPGYARVSHSKRAPGPDLSVRYRTRYLREPYLGARCRIAKDAARTAAAQGVFTHPKELP